MDKFVSMIKSKYQQDHPVNKTQIYIPSDMPIENSKKYYGCTG